MSTKPSSSSSPDLLNLEEQLTCPVCLDHYTNPKTLPCLHSFCEHCLEGLPLDKKNKTYYLSCPTCRHCTELPEEGARAFPVAFTLNNLKEMYSAMKNNAVKKTEGLPNPQEATCRDHGKPLELFCETCNTVICVTCQVRNHKHHEYNLITDSYTKHCQKLRECLSPVEGKKEALKKVLSALAEREGEIRGRGEGVLKEIHEMVEEMMNVLRHSERKLTEQAKRVTDAKLKVLCTQFYSFLQMATKPSSSSSPGLLKLEEQLNCPVCLDHYTNPKTLPCLHSFCEHCLEGLPLDKKNKTYYLSCPTCRHCTELPEEGAGAFPVAFTLNNIKEMHNLMNRRTADLPNLQEATCSDHGKPLEFFCETCDTVVCSHCPFRNHKHHEYDLITDCYTKHFQKLRECLSPVEGKKEALKKVLSALAEREGEIRERGEGILEEIHEMVEEMVNVLRQSERKLTEQAKRVTDAKLKVLSEQMKSAEISLSVLEDVKDYVEQSLKTGSPQQVLRSKKQMIVCMSEITAGINMEELHPKEKADFVLSKDIKSLHHIGDVVTYSSTALQQCRVKKICCFEHLPKKKKFSFSLSMEAPDSSLLSVPLCFLRCSLVPVGKGLKPIHTKVTTTSTDLGVYRIQCNPSTSGTHTVKVQVYDVHLEDTSLVIPFNPYLDSITPACTITELKGPYVVAVSDDNHVIITESDGNCVTILDREGTKVKSLGEEGGSGIVKFFNPRGVTITPDKLILVFDGNHRIQKLSMDGYLIASVGKEGSGPLQFKYPDSIAISPITGQVYTADRDNHRIQVLNPDLTFSHSFGSKGSANGQFERPLGIAFDHQGLVYVADADNHRIQKFSPDGKFVGNFGNKRLSYPIGIAIDTAATGLVYVSEYVNNCISVFTSDGAFVRKFGSKGNNIDQFYTPCGLAFDKDGV
uniref:RING-type domain-containing protein n=1 Tax=Amphimedon queenslandica TaxID=400682 RepID=A0A1X7TVR9_AMPQE